MFNLLKAKEALRGLVVSKFGILSQAVTSVWVRLPQVTVPNPKTERQELRLLFILYTILL